MTDSSLKSDKAETHVLISGLVYDQGKSGIAEYTRQLVGEFCRQKRVSIALLKKDIPYFPINENNARILPVSNIFAHPLMSILWHALVLPCILLQRKYDWLLLPAINRRMGLWFPKPALGIAHDLSQFSVEKKYDIFRTFYVKCLLPLFTSSLSHIVAISQNTKEDLIQYWRIPSEKISVRYNGFDQGRFHQVEPVDATEVLSSYAIDRPYFVYVSRIENPGKNHIRLIEAFDDLEDSQAQDKLLIFAGGDWNGADQVRSIAAKAKRAEQIRFLGYVPTEHLPTLYHRAELMVFPSLYEGFGIPLVEAMACGTTCVCSNNSALGELAGDVAFTFDPHSSSDIRRTLSDVIEQPIVARERVAKGRTYCLQFSWAKLAEHLSLLIDQRNLKTQLRGVVKQISSQSSS